MYAICVSGKMTQFIVDMVLNGVLNKTETNARGTQTGYKSTRSTASVVINDYSLASVPAPDFRAGYASCIYNNVLYIFGGIHDNNGASSYSNDVWAKNLGAGSITIQSTTVPSQGWILITTSGTSPASRYASAFGMYNGYLIVWGGWNGGFLGDINFLDLSTYTWTQGTTSGAPAARQNAIGVVAGTKFYVGTGLGNSSVHYNDLYSFDLSQATISSGAWTLITSNGGFTGRTNSCGVVNDAGTAIYFFGGQNSSNTALGDMWKFTISGATFTQITTTGSPGARWWHAMAFSNGYVWVMQGTSTASGGANAFNDLWRWNETTPAWSSVITTLPATRMNHFINMNGNNAIVFGGMSKYTYGAGCYNDTWTADFSQATPVFNQLTGGQVWVNASSFTLGGFTLTASISGGVIVFKKTVSTNTDTSTSSINLSSVRTLST